jgi:TolA-binding protein
MNGSRLRGLTAAALVLAAVFAAVGWARPAHAADATTSAPPAKPKTYPDTPDGVRAQIADLEKQIASLNAEAEKLVSVSDQDKRNAIRKQIKSLKLQVRILQRRAEQLDAAAGQAGVDQIRERYRQRIREFEQRKAAIRRETIARFEAELSKRPDSRLAPDILWRLANLYFEEAHASYLDQWDRYEDQSNQLYSQGATNVVPEEPKHNYVRSVDLLGQILKNYPNYEHKDKVLYLLAYCLQEQNDDDRALLVYDRLIAETADSDYVPEAYVRQGEIYFARDQFERAIERYQHLLKYSNSKFYDKALYKLGWSYYKKSDYENAVKYFTAVLDFYKNRPITARRKGKADDLLQESVDYIAISFTEAEGQNGAAAAVAFMQRQKNPDLGRQIIAKVGEVYDERTDYEAARSAYRAYLQYFPLAPEVPEVYSKIAQTYEKESRFEDAVAIYTEIGKKLGPDSEWARANGGKGAEIEKADKYRQTSILAAATFHHEKAQKSSGAESQAHYQKAIENYELYLQYFPNSDSAYETTFNLAECYMELQAYPQAAAKYAKIVELHKDKDLWANAVFNTAKAYELQVEKEGGLPNKEALAERDKQISKGGDASTAPKGMEIRPSAMSETIQKWVAALEAHVAALPNSDKSPAMTYKIGEISYLHGDFENARKWFEQVFDKYPNNPVVAFAAYYYIESYKQRGDYAGIIAATRRLPKGGAIGITPEQVQSLTAGATFKIAEQKLRDSTAVESVESDKVMDAINEYERGIAANPNDKLADVAVLNIAVAYENQLKDLVRANEAYLRLARNYPKSEHAPEALLRAGFNYQVLVEFDKALEAYDLFYHTFPNHKEAGNALFNAAALREEAGRSSEAVPLYEQYLSKFATTTDAAETAFTIATLYEKTGNSSAAERAYESYAQRGADEAGRMSEAYLRWGKLLDARGQGAEADKRYMQAVAVFVRAKEADPNAEARFAGEAQFLVAERYYGAYKTMVFTGNIKKDAELLKTKAEAFKRLKDLYEQIVTFGNYRWATAALHMIGVINQDFSESLLKAPLPKDLPPEQQDEYMFKLEEIAFPIKNRALEAFKQNVQKGINERLVNEWIVKSYLELKKLEPQTVEPKFEKALGGEAPSLAQADIDPTLPAPAAPPPGAVTPPPGAAPTTGGGK